MFEPAHCMHWTPLYTQQLRLRHLVRIIGYNVALDPSVGKGLYYTLHVATMCAPFYTSDQQKSSNPKWRDLDISDSHGHNSGVVVRIWQHNETKFDTVVSVWGVYFSGLVYLGNKSGDLQPIFFDENALIFQFIGGFFTSQYSIKEHPTKPIPFLSNVNITTNTIFRKTDLSYSNNKVRPSYTVDKLQRLHTLQLAIRNKKLDTDALRDKIYEKCPIFDSTGSSHIPIERPMHSNQKVSSLSMSVKSLNKYLNQQSQPSRSQRQEAWRLKKLIETAKFNCKLLSHEKDRKKAYLRQLTQTCNNLCDENEDQGILLMEKYRQLSRDLEKLREWRKTYIDTRESCLHATVYLNLKRKDLLAELLDIYPILKVADEKLTICGVHLPDSESLSDCEDTSLSVALGYVTHVVQMASIYLHTPLRYPVVHNGSRSKIYDHIIEKIADKEREFPLYARRKDQLQFHYALYLLNKNIAQLRWYCGIPTSDLRLTLENLYSFLQFRNETGARGMESPSQGQSGRSTGLKGVSTPPHPLKQKSQRQNKPDGNTKAPSENEIPVKPASMQAASSTPRSMLGAQLASANLTRQTITCCDKQNGADPPTALLSSHCVDCNIEQGLDLLDPQAGFILCNTFNEHSIDIHDAPQHSSKPLITRSVGSYNGEQQESILYNMSPSSEPMLGRQNATDIVLPDSFQGERTEFLQEWLNSGPALVCSEEHLYPEEILGTTATYPCTDPSGHTTNHYYD